MLYPVDGVAESRFTCDDPGGAAWRLAALLDGLALHVTVHHGPMSRVQMLEHARTAVCLELGLRRDALPTATEIAAPRGNRGGATA